MRELNVYVLRLGFIMKWGGRGCPIDLTQFRKFVFDITNVIKKMRNEMNAKLTIKIATI